MSTDEGQQPRRRRVGGYSPIELVERCATGPVYTARQESLDRLVTLKVLAPDQARDPAGRERFFRYARDVAKLRHPRIVSGLDVGEDDGFCYVVFERPEGRDVRTLLERGALTEELAVRVARDVAAGLTYLHDLGVIHGRVHPGCIVITDDGPAKLGGLGLTRLELLLGNGQTLHRGLAEYASPEQAGSKELGPETDVYGLGATLFHMLAGRPVFDGEDTQVVLGRQLYATPPPLHSFVETVSPEIEAVVNRALAKDAVDRYASAKEIGDALDALLRTPPSPGLKALRTPPSAAGAPVPRRRRRRRRRRRF